MKNIENSKSILVPHDFTPAGEAALHQANIFALKMNKAVTLLHVIPSYEMKMETMLKLQAIASANQRATGVETGYTTSTGTIFEQIGQAADILNSAFVVMGTHGITGMQKIVGSYALKVITKSHTPYIVVQKNPVHKIHQNIVVPIDYEPESKQPIFHIMNIAKLFDATCHIIYKINKDVHINNKIMNNVAYVENFLTENSIKYENVCLEKSNTSFSDEFLSYAENINADLITLITEQNLTLVEFFMRPNEQYIIANKQKIPVMCIHPDYNALKYGSVFAS